MASAGADFIGGDYMVGDDNEKATESMKFAPTDTPPIVNFGELEPGDVLFYRLLRPIENEERISRVTDKYQRTLLFAGWDLGLTSARFSLDRHFEAQRHATSHAA